MAGRVDPGGPARYQRRMRRLSLSRSGGIVLVLVLLVAALGGRMAPATPSDPALAAYVAMGGSLADLCGGHGGLDGQGGSGHCDGCGLVGAATVPEPCAAGRPERVEAASAAAGHALPLPAAARRPWASRAPPAGAA
jgi:hypothetical protein